MYADEPLQVRKTPCASCPYRQNVPSGVWEAGEYERLKAYDGDIAEQAEKGAFRVFGCHQDDIGSELCAGWVGHREHPADLLALRLSRAEADVFEYHTDVELFASGEEAAQHGMQDIEAPSDRAQATIEKIVRKRNL